MYFHSFAYTFAFISNATESYHLALKSVLTKYSKILNLQCCCCFVLCFFRKKITTNPSCSKLCSLQGFAVAVVFWAVCPRLILSLSSSCPHRHRLPAVLCPVRVAARAQPATCVTKASVLQTNHDPEAPAMHLTNKLPGSSGSRHAEVRVEA